MKHTITELEAPNEPILGNYCFDTFFRDFPSKEYPVSYNSVSKLLFFTHESTPRYEEHKTDAPELDRQEDFWTLHFDGSKTKEGAGVGCVLIDPVKKKTLIACILEFDCTNNVVEYEALIQGLKKAIDLGVKDLKVFRDS